MNEMNQLPLAIATVPMQRFEKLYPLEKALQRGTLFQAHKNKNFDLLDYLAKY